MIRISQADIPQIEEDFQLLVDEGPAQLITVIWKGETHKCFTPKKHDDGQMVLDGMEMPSVRKICQRTQEGE